MVKCLFFYSKVEDLELLISTSKIYKVIQQGLDKEILNEEEANEMNPNLKELAKLVMPFKVHKPHDSLTAPPPRPIISGSGSISENIAVYVEHNLKHIAAKHSTYIQDILSGCIWCKTIYCLTYRGKTDD